MELLLGLTAGLAIVVIVLILSIHSKNNTIKMRDAWIDGLCGSKKALQWQIRILEAENEFFKEDILKQKQEESQEKDIVRISEILDIQANKSKQLIKIIKNLH